MRRATLALLFVACALLSSFLTYMIVSGYWYRLGITVPGLPSVAITKVIFPTQNTSYFKVKVLNPSYSLRSVELRDIYVITPEGEAHRIENTTPPLPKELEAGKAVMLTCLWDWANYTGQELKILAIIEDGSGASYLAKPPSVKLVLEAVFNASRPFWFLLNITNSPKSPVAVNLTGVDLVLDNGTRLEGITTKPRVSPEKPYGLEPNSTLTLNCTWNWLRYRDRNFTVVVKTIQGYRSYRSFRTPGPVVIRIWEVAFYTVGTMYYFNITVFNEPKSPAPARICHIEVVVNNTCFGPEDLNMTPPLRPPVVLQPNSSITFTCLWNWSKYLGYDMAISVETVLGYTANATVRIAPGTHRLALGLSGPSRLCNSPSSKGLLLCVPPAQRRTSTLCALAPSPRSSRPVWLPRRPRI